MRAMPVENSRRTDEFWLILAPFGMVGANETERNSTPSRPRSVAGFSWQSFPCDVATVSPLRADSQREKLAIRRWLPRNQHKQIPGTGSLSIPDPWRGSGRVGTQGRCQLTPAVVSEGRNVRSGKMSTWRGCAPLSQRLGWPPGPYQGGKGEALPNPMNFHTFHVKPNENGQA